MRKALCAICDETNQTVNLCAACKADPANTGWNWKEDVPCDNIAAENAEALDAFLDEQQGERAPEITPTFQAVAQLVRYGERVRYPRRCDRQGRRRGFRYKYQPCSTYRIAELAGCSQSYVMKIIRYVERRAGDEKIQ